MELQETWSKYYNKFTEIKPLSTEKQKDLFDLSKVKNAIFLAGPCPRKDSEDDWRDDKAYKILNNLEFDGTVLNPTNRFFSNTDLAKQTEWESEAMHKASAIVFSLDKSENHKGFTSNIEFGMWCQHPSIFVHIPKDNSFGANNYIRLKCKEFNIPIYDTLEDTLAAAVRDLKRQGTNWFLSDTHFGQERTLNLSKRPFLTVDHMNKALISNWNKRIRVTDTVYFLGDFGDSTDYLDCLNFRELNFIKGNYERRDDNKDFLKKLKSMKNVNVFDQDECTLSINGFNYIMRHEPINGKKIPKDYICLYGHVHDRSKVKSNGFDVGVDGNNYKPYSQEEIDFYANALKQGFYDKNIFSTKCE